MSSQKELTLKTLKLFVIHSLISNGFDQVQDEVINVFTEVLSTYIKRLASETKNLSALANKTDSSIFDLLLLLNHLNFRLSEISDYIIQDMRSNNMRMPISSEILGSSKNKNDSPIKNIGTTNIREHRMVKITKLKNKISNLKFNNNANNKSLGNENNGNNNDNNSNNDMRDNMLNLSGNQNNIEKNNAGNNNNPKNKVSSISSNAKGEYS
jgi:hypothetical protein